MVSVNSPTHTGQIYDHGDFKIGHRIYDERNELLGKDPYSYDKCVYFHLKI